MRSCNSHALQAARARACRSFLLLLLLATIDCVRWAILEGCGRYCKAGGLVHIASSNALTPARSGPACTPNTARWDKLRCINVALALRETARRDPGRARHQLRTAASVLGWSACCAAPPARAIVFCRCCQQNEAPLLTLAQTCPPAPPISGQAMARTWVEPCGLKARACAPRVCPHPQVLILRHSTRPIREPCDARRGHATAD